MEGQLIFIELHHDCFISKSAHQPHKVGFLSSVLEIRNMRLREVKNYALGHKRWCGRVWFRPGLLTVLCLLAHGEVEKIVHQSRNDLVPPMYMYCGWWIYVQMSI